MCLKDLTRCFCSPDVERDLSSPDRRPEQHKKHHDGAWSNPKTPESSDILGKPREFGDSNKRVASYSPPEVTEGKHESPKRAPQVSTLAEKGNSDHSPKVQDRGGDPYELPSRSPVKIDNATGDGFVSKYETQPSPKEPNAPAKASGGSENRMQPKVGHKDIASDGDFRAKGQTKAKDTNGGSDETVESKTMVKDPL